MKLFIKFYILLFMAITQGEASHRALDILVTSSRCFTPKLHFHSSFRTPALLCTSPTLMGKGRSRLPIEQTRLAAPEPIDSIDIVNPCSDFGFKRAFRDPQVAIGFLNEILSLSGSDTIEQLEYVDHELQSRAPGGRDFRVDVLCRTEKKEWFLLEMQNDYRFDYPDKALIEFCRLISSLDAPRYRVLSEHLEEGQEDLEDEEKDTDSEASESNSGKKKKRKKKEEFWNSIPRLITLVMTNKEFPVGQRKERFPDQDLMEPNIINTYTLRHTERQERLLGNIDARIVLVMLANFRKPAKGLVTDTDKWLFALKDEKLRTGRKKMDVYKHVDSLAAVKGNNPSLRRFYQLLNKDDIGADQLRRYEEDIELVNTEMERRFDEGRAAGKEEGIAEGRKTVLSKAVHALHKSGKSNPEIALDLGIDEIEVESMKNNKEGDEFCRAK